MNRATVPIPEKLFFKIGEVCELSGVQAHVLRYWESEFPMLAPQKNRAGQRTYRKRDVEIALRIKELLYEDQYTIAGAKKKLASELRGMSKLRAVTSDTNALSQDGPAKSIGSPDIAPEAFDEPAISPPAAFPTEVPPEPPTPVAPQLRSGPAHANSISAEQRRALRGLAIQLRDLLRILDSNEDDPMSSQK